MANPNKRTYPTFRYYLSNTGDSLQEDTDTNQANIATNTANIQVNATNIDVNSTDIATNAANIATNASGVANNDAQITINTTDIATNTANISANASDIATNAADIDVANENTVIKRGHSWAIDVFGPGTDLEITNLARTFTTSRDNQMILAGAMVSGTTSNDVGVLYMKLDGVDMQTRDQPSNLPRVVGLAAFPYATHVSTVSIMSNAIVAAAGAHTITYHIRFKTAAESFRINATQTDDNNADHQRLMSQSYVMQHAS